MALQRRKLSVGMPSQPGGELNLNKGARHHPNYSLNSIQPNPENPRKPDLVKAGIDLDAIKALRKKPSESLGEFEERLNSWIEKNVDLDAEQKTYWQRFLSFSLSIARDGLLQPISIRESKPNVRIATIIAGERRFLAHWLIGETTIGAMVTHMEDEKASMLSLIENFQREEVSLEGTILGMRVHQQRFGTKFSMSEVARITNVSKGSAQGVYYAVNAEDDHPVLEEIRNGNLSKPYHLKKYFDELNGKSPSPSKGKQEIDRSNLTDEQPDQAKSDRSNLTDSDNGKKDNSTRSRQSGQQGDETKSKRSNLTASGNAEAWEPVRNFLASVCLDMLRMDGTEYQDVSGRIDQVHTPEDLHQLIAELAQKHEGAID